MRRIHAATPITGLPADPPPAIDPVADSGRSSPLEVIDRVDELTVVLRPSKLLRTEMDVCRTAAADPAICDVVQVAPREVSIIGKRRGTTCVTFWFGDRQHRPVTFLIRVAPDPETDRIRGIRCEFLEDALAKLFPESKVTLAPLADKLIVRQRAHDEAEASHILAVIRDEAVIGGAPTESGHRD